MGLIDRARTEHDQLVGQSFVPQGVAGIGHRGRPHPTPLGQLASEHRVRTLVEGRTRPAVNELDRNDARLSGAAGELGQSLELGIGVLVGDDAATYGHFAAVGDDVAGPTPVDEGHRQRAQADLGGSDSLLKAGMLGLHRQHDAGRPADGVASEIGLGGVGRLTVDHHFEHTSTLVPEYRGTVRRLGHH